MRLTKEQILRIPKMVLTMTFKEIGAEFGITADGVDYHVERLREAGIEVPTRRGPRPIKLKGKKK